MPQILLVAVGRLREPHWRQAAETYATRLRRRYDFTEITIKDGDADLSASDRIEVEGARILHALKGNVTPICLDENGETMRSTAFARYLRVSFETAQTPCFIIGGAYGLADAVRKRAAKTLSLGLMTLPHELARVVLLEQLYRADAIMRNSPYHHG